MQFVYHNSAGEELLKIDGELYNYLFKARRQEKSEELYLRNLKDIFLYRYEIEYLDKKQATLRLIFKEEKIVTVKRKLHIGWCKIEFKNIEKIIASLNEIGVEKITFIECQYSQRNIQINFEKLEKLLHNSSSQSGRSDIIKLDYVKSLDDFLKIYPETYMFNFSNNDIEDVKDNIDTIILGCEGGFSLNEISKFAPDKVIGIKSNIILKSETAAISIASKLIM
jgi:16S rRNA (uracil1498-N3)-methyltransferase